MRTLTERTFALVTGAMLHPILFAQAPLSLDDSFRASFDQWYVSSILPMEDGTVILSGQIKIGSEFFFRSGIRVFANGALDESFPLTAYMGGKLTRWDERIYSGNGQGLRRHFLNGQLDAVFDMISDPLSSPLQGGDYHVYPDGRILMSGAHSLYDTARGYVGIYNLIWFTNTGYLDTTKTHRYCNGVIYEIEEQADGKFLCSGTCTTYEGQPVRRIFRVHPDGALDTSFDSQVTWGRASEFLVLDDERIVAVGRFGMPDLPNDTIRMARFLSNGDLDPTFDHTISFGLGDIPNALDLGVIPNSIEHWPGDRYLVTGTFQQVEGQPRYGLCVVDSTGMLMPEFSGAGVGTYVYQGQVLGGVTGTVLTPENMLYVYGGYHGYTDGTTNDPDQRFITRLYGPDLTTAVSVATEPAPVRLLIAPNPTQSWATVTYTLLEEPTDGRIVVKDLFGRVVITERMAGTQGQVVLDTRPLSKGVYTVECTTGQVVLRSDRLVVQ